MRILALETTERIGSVAAFDGDNVLICNDLSRDVQGAQSLAPGIRDLLDQVGWLPADVELVAVTQGPGSFTGLRIGLTTAKVFAYATGAALLGVDTLHVIATQTPDDVDDLAVAIDAQRGDLVVQRFRRNDRQQIVPIDTAALVSVDIWLEGLLPGMHITGPVLRKLTDRIPAGVEMVPSEYWPPKAATVARLAAQRYVAGERDDIWTLLPHYSRRSAAEEKWEARQQHEADRADC